MQEHNKDESWIQSEMNWTNTKGDENDGEPSCETHTETMGRNLTNTTEQAQGEN